MQNALSVVASTLWHYLARMARRTKSGLERRFDTSLLAGFLDTRFEDDGRAPAPKRKTPGHEQRLRASVDRANRRVGVKSFAGLTDEEILNRISD